MLPGVRMRGELFIEPMPPTMVPYTGPPFASAPWQDAHFAAYTCLPSATEPRPAGRPWPSEVRMSMFHGATSASEIGLPKRGLSASGCTACGADLPSGIPVEDFSCIPPPPRLAQEITVMEAASA